MPQNEKLVKDFDVVRCFNQSQAEEGVIGYLFSSEESQINVYGLVAP